MIRLLCFIVVIALLSGCAGSPRIDDYTLDAPPFSAAPGADSSPLSILLGPVTLAEMVDRPQLVIRTGDNRVEIVDTSRWAQPLKGESARVLAANLAREMGTPRVYRHGQGMTGDPDIRVAVDILRFESQPGVEVTIEALWSVRRKGSDTPITGRSEAHEAVQGDSYDPLVAAHGRALAHISRDIAKAIRAAGFDK